MIKQISIGVAFLALVITVAAIKLPDPTFPEGCLTAPLNREFAEKLGGNRCQYRFQKKTDKIALYYGEELEFIVPEGFSIRPLDPVSDEVCPGGKVRSKTFFATKGSCPISTPTQLPTQAVRVNA